MKTPIQKAIEFYQDIQLSQISKLEKENKELKDLIQELFEYYPNTRGYDDVRKELLKTINKD